MKFTLASCKACNDKKIKDKVLLNVIVSEIDRFWKFISKSVYLNSKTIELDRRLLKNYIKIMDISMLK